MKLYRTERLYRTVRAERMPAGRTAEPGKTMPAARRAEAEKVLSVRILKEERSPYPVKMQGTVTMPAVRM